MARQRVHRYPGTFRRMAVERFNRCENATALARELGIERGLLYKWRRLQERAQERPGAKAGSGEGKLHREIGELKRLLAEKALEVDFFKGALQKIEARRQGQGGSGAKASTTKSGK